MPSPSSVILAHLGCPLLLAGLISGQVTFLDVAPQTGTDRASFGRGSALVDLDGDGLKDIVNANAGMDNDYYRQLANGTFVDERHAWGVPSETDQSWGILAADFDNDGDIDVYIPTGGYMTGSDRFLRNDLNSAGVLTDVSSQGGDLSNPHASFGGSAVDFNRDGFLDIFEGEADLTDGSGVCRLLLQTGLLVFTDVSQPMGMTEQGDYRHCGVGDYDNDGWPDLGAANYYGPNRLYTNSLGVGITELAQAVGILPLTLNYGPNFGMVFTDLNNDGLLDIYIAQYSRPPRDAITQLWVNLGTGSFQDAAPHSGIGFQEDMGHDAGDVDGDGYPDILAGTGSPPTATNDVLYHITPMGTTGLIATDISQVSGINANGPTRLHGMAFGDYDADGDIDIYCNNGGPSTLPNTIQTNFLWQNQGNANAWTAVKLVGLRSNRTGVGARLVATTTSGAQVHRNVDVGRGFSNTPDHVVHFGLGSATGLSQIEINWPSGIVQTILLPPLGVQTEVVETGVVLLGDLVPGNRVFFEFCGTPGQRVDAFVSPNAAFVPVPELGGILELAPPFIPLGSLDLSPGGQGALPLLIPADPALIGSVFHAQAWIRPLSAPLSGTLTRSIQLVF